MELIKQLSRLNFALWCVVAIIIFSEYFATDSIAQLWGMGTPLLFAFTKYYPQEK